MNQRIRNALQGKITGSYEDKAVVFVTSLLENANDLFAAIDANLRLVGLALAQAVVLAGSPAVERTVQRFRVPRYWPQAREPIAFPLIAPLLFRHEINV